MRQGSLVRLGPWAVALGVSAGLVAPGPAAARPTATESTFVVVLECPGVTQRVAPDSTGSFVFKDVPAGACKMSLAPTTATDPAATVASSSPAASPSSSASSVVAPRDAASGMATGKRMHKPMSFKLSLVGESAAAASARADDASSTSVTVTVQERQKELKGHVTLIK
jgi:hypothetical protein